MVIAVVLLISIVVSLIDVVSHRIPNRLNLALFFVLIFDMHRVPLGDGFILFICVLLISIACRAGGGDIKLFAVLIVTQGRYIASFNYLLGLCISLTLMAMVTVVRRQSLEGSIALAPAILAPFLWLYLEF
ncbi:MAG: prepilin peptidase [Candidatus Planktophila sp.]